MKTRDEIQDFIYQKRFPTRGLPFTKKMWRDGYNKALDDFFTFLTTEPTDTSEGSG